jgi:hypothetical protein
MIVKYKNVVIGEIVKVDFTKNIFKIVNAYHGVWEHMVFEGYKSAKETLISGYLKEEERYNLS